MALQKFSFWFGVRVLNFFVKIFSVSLSSLDSEEQESLRAAERLHNRSSRNSTGGISTHSLNEAELAVSAITSILYQCNHLYVESPFKTKQKKTPPSTCSLPL